MTWLYNLQSRAGLTGPEGTAALLIIVALAGGLIANQVQSSAAPIAPNFYAAADAAFVRPALDSTAASNAPTLLASVTDSVAVPTESLPEWADSLSTETEPPSPAAYATAEVESAASSRSSAKPPPRRLNINTASVEDLQCLPRVGPALAARIVEYRRVNGRFRTAAQITEVKGIGDRTMEKLTPWIFV